MALQNPPKDLLVVHDLDHVRVSVLPPNRRFQWIRRLLGFDGRTEVNLGSYSLRVEGSGSLVELVLSEVVDTRVVREARSAVVLVETNQKSVRIPAEPAHADWLCASIHCKVREARNRERGWTDTVPKELRSLMSRDT